MASYETRYETFLQSKQPPVALQLAMEDFFAPDLPEEYRKTYGDYLHRRIRPLAEKLIEQEDLDKLEILDQLQWLTPNLVDEFAKMAKDKQKSAALVWLLTKKQETYGFKRESFEL